MIKSTKPSIALISMTISLIIVVITTAPIIKGLTFLGVPVWLQCLIGFFYGYNVSSFTYKYITNLHNA